MITGIPFYQEAKDVYHLAIQHWSKVSQNMRVEQLRRAQEARENPRLCKFLSWKYKDYPLLEWCNSIYPVVVFPAPEHQQRNLNSVLSYPLLEDRPKPETFAAREPSFRVLLEKLGAPIQNRLTYTLARLNMGDALQLTCALGCYYYALDTCHSLEWEILSNLVTLGERGKFENFDRKLKLRSALHEKVDNPIVDGGGRSTAIGVSTLIAYNDNGKTRLWLKRRSKWHVAVNSGLVHVLPSFMFQPVTACVDDEYNVSHNIFREYLEEIFDRGEPTRGEEEVHNYFYDDPRLQYLHILLGRQDAELRFTGVAIDLLTLRPEICTLLWIKTSDWFNRHSRSGGEERFKLNLEFMRDYDEQETLDWLVTPMPFSHDDSDLLKHDYLSPSRISPPGAAALYLGLKQLRELI